MTQTQRVLVRVVPRRIGTPTGMQTVTDVLYCWMGADGVPCYACTRYNYVLSNTPAQRASEAEQFLRRQEAAR